MAQTLKFGNKTWATKVGSTLAYNDENGNYKPLPFAFTRSTSATRVNKEGLIEVVTNDRPRIDYTDSSDGVLLLEKAATNLITYSQDFSNSYWTKSAASVLSGFVSPDGNNNAFKFIEDSSNSQHFMYSQNSGGSVGNEITTSFFVKSESRNWCRIIGYNGSSVWFDLKNGAIGTQTNAIGKIKLISNGWYKISSSYTSSNSNNEKAYLYLANGNDNVSYQGDGTSGFYVWGSQLELGNLSSYIPTQGSATTRVAETASGSGNSEVFNDSEGVLFADISALSDDGTSRRISLTDVSGSTFLNLVSIELDESSGVLKAFVSDSSTIDTLQGNIIQTQYNKIALKYNASSISLYVNGFKLDSNNAPNLPNGLKILDFNNGQSNQISEFYGKTKELGYYNTALTDAELETLTSYRSWESMVNELNLNIIYNG